jgi:hypothetical protein
VGWVWVEFNSVLWNCTSLLSGRLSVAYCNADFSAQTENKISMKIDVFSYRRAHRHASCSSGALCRGFGAIMCDTQLSNVLKALWTRNFTQHSHCTFRPVLFSLSSSYLSWCYISQCPETQNSLCKR